jgi:hypothetical protein
MIIDFDRAYLNARANLAGRMARKGSVKNATAKQTAAPTRHPRNPSNLEYPGSVSTHSNKLPCRLYKDSTSLRKEMENIPLPT